MIKVAKYWTVFRISVMDALVYIVDFLGRSLFFAFIMAVYMLLWKAIYGGGGQTIEGFSINNIIWYLAMTEIITLSSTNYYVEVSNDVKTGNIAYQLNKPYHYVPYAFANHMGKIGIRFLVNVVVGNVVAYLLVGPNEGGKISLDYFLLVSISMLLGMFLNYFINLSLALSAFWVEENIPFRWIYNKLVFTLGGMLIPLEFFPKILKDVSMKLPFAYVTYGPGKLTVKYSMDNAISLIGGQLIYLAIAVVVCFGLFGMGVKKLNVNGG